MFAQVDTLPGSQAKGPIPDGDGQTRSHQRRLDMGRHVVRSLDRVNIREVFRNDVVQSGFEIDPHIGIRIFVEGQTGRSVLNEDMQQPDTDTGQFRDRVHHRSSDQMTSTSVGSEGQGAMMPNHKAIIAILPGAQGRGCRFFSGSLTRKPRIPTLDLSWLLTIEDSFGYFQSDFRHVTIIFPSGDLTHYAPRKD
jgi:hypothetical protein